METFVRQFPKLGGAQMLLLVITRKVAWRNSVCGTFVSTCMSLQTEVFLLSREQDFNTSLGSMKASTIFS